MPVSTVGRKILYLGTDPSSYERDGCVIHYPVIKIVPKPYSDPSIQTMLDMFSLYTHILLTSKNAVEIFCGLLKEKKISERVLHSKRWVSIGEVTTKRLALFGVTSNLTSKVSTQEGLVDCLKELDMKGSYVLLPKSSLSRPVLSSYLKEERISHALVDLYDTVVNTSLTPIDLLEIDEIVFTSPSTVRAFFSYGMTVPENIHLTAIGPITQAALDAQSSPSLK